MELGDWLIPLLAVGYLTAGAWTGVARRRQSLVPEPIVSPPPAASVAPPVAEEVRLPEPAPAEAVVATPTVTQVPTRPAVKCLPGKGEWQHLIGRRIEAVVMNRRMSSGKPFAQLYLVLDGGCHFEIYSTEGALSGLKGLYRGDLDDVLRFKCVQPDAKVYGDRRLVPRDEDGPQVLWP